MASQEINSTAPRVLKVESLVTVQDPISGDSRQLRQRERIGPWTLMAVLHQARGQRLAIFENLQETNGPIVYIGEEGMLLGLPKTLEPTRVPEGNCYRGHSKEEMLQSAQDILGQEILAQEGDPSYDEVAACLPPIRHIRNGMGAWGRCPHTFVGSRASADAVPVLYDGFTARVEPPIIAPEIRQMLPEERLWEGLVGGWLPAIRYVYPVHKGLTWEMVAFGEVSPPTVWIQPVWYRFLKLENGELKEAHYLHSYIPYPWRKEPEPETFYAELLKLHVEWSRSLTEAMEIDVPEEWIADFCRHSLVREMITRVGDHPRYGVVDRYYGGPEHDGFQDTFNSSVITFLEWGPLGIARGYIGNYFSEFVREDGSIDYRGPETAQYGRMLTTLAQYYRYTGDHELLLRYDPKAQAIVGLLMARREQAKQLPKDDPAYGMIVGWDEADSCQKIPDPFAYELPYFSNSAEACRGFHDLGQVWMSIGEQVGKPDLVARGQKLVAEAASLRQDIRAAVEHSTLHHTTLPYVPMYAGGKVPYDLAADRGSPAGYATARTRAEILHSGVLTKDVIQKILQYSYMHSGTTLGIFGERERITAFTVYGEAYGLIQHDLVRELLLFYYAHAAHCHTRGTWTALESVDVDRDRANHAPYCAPAQMTIPTVTKWMLVFEDPFTPTLWLAKATPRAWLRSGQRVSVRNAPTSWGKISYEIVSTLDDGQICATVDLPVMGAEATLKLRLRLPKPYAIQSVLINGKPWQDFDPCEETVTVPPGTAGRLSAVIRCTKAS